MPFGYNGQRLVIDLTTEKIMVESPEEKWYRTYLGGMSSIAYHLLNEVKAREDPLGPKLPSQGL